MKTSIRSAIFALLVAATPMFAVIAQQSEPQTSTLKAGLYFSNDGKLNINVENNFHKGAKIQILDNTGKVVYKKYTAGSTPLSSVKLDVAHLANGDYEVVVSNGKDQVKHPLQLGTSKPERSMVVGQ